MSEKRMTKGWVHFGSNDLGIHTAKSREDRVKYDKKANQMLRTVKKLSAEELMKEKAAAEAEKTTAKAKREKAIAEGRLKVEKPKKRYNKRAK